MTTTKKTPAQIALHFISKKYFKGRNFNDEVWFDTKKPDPSGLLTGTVYKIHGKGKSSEIGNFQIHPNGFVAKFPTAEKAFLDEINEGKGNMAPIMEAPANEGKEKANEEQKRPRGRPRRS